MSGIEERLNAELTRALKAGDHGVVDAVRMAKSKLVERQKAPGFQGPMTDRVAQEVIGAYVKGLKKAVDEITSGGGGDRPILAKYRSEIEYLAGYLPRTLPEDETRTLVRETLASLGVAGPSQVGRVMGTIMKAHKDEVDAALVKRLVEEELSR